MKAKLTTRVAVGAAMSAVLLSAAALPAHADPAAGAFGQLVGLGSDTTQDVMNGLSGAIGQNLIGSYDATGSSTTVVTRSGGSAIPRANGSGAGVKLLLTAIGQTGSQTISTSSDSKSVTTADVSGKVDFARSSSGAGANADDAGVLTYIPFGLDAVTVATSPTSVIPTDLTSKEIVSIYKGEIDRVEYKGDESKLLAKGAAVDEGFTAVTITPLIPQAGSGTRSYWLGQLGISEAELTKYPIKDKDLAGKAVQEHKGAALVAGDAELQKATLVPFSVAQWIAQANAKVTDHRDGAVLHSVDGKDPLASSAAPYSLNEGYKGYVRLVYNVVPTVLADDPTSQIAKTFVGTDSLVCKQKDVIKAYGFGLIENDCGATTSKAYRASDSSLEAVVPASATAGKAVTLSASVVSNGDQGGIVEFTAAGKVIATATVAAGKTSGSTQWTPAASGAVEVSATFIPTLPGIAAAEAAAQTINVAAAASTAPTNPKPNTNTSTPAKKATAKVKVTKAKANAKKRTAILTIKVTAKGVKAKSIGGKITVKLGKKTVGKGKVSKGTAKISVKKLKKGKNKLTVSYAGTSTIGKAAISRNVAIKR
ncbi:hypothetical protein [Rarobacter incanus]|uniref:ABC-type phosphate transport system substrate-binding protein n=1 Tax=Rarobacter incanus TaxID=153494 RepID=A0A542SRH9_9MICO|nr:hypothetical protein [Rarobacter incanus]TQK77212.1 ABC-type phosphate transport system substrate-binding protein [Rarobacter incanus]